MIRRLLCSALAWLLLASSASAQSLDVRPVLTDPPPAAVPAQGAQAPAPVPPPDIERMAHPDGRPGYWLNDAAYTDALAALTLEAGYLEQLALLNRRLALRTTEANELRLALGAMTRARDEIRAVVRTAEARRVAAERDRDRWYRQPFVLLGTGVVLGAGFAILMAFAIGGST